MNAVVTGARNSSDPVRGVPGRVYNIGGGACASLEVFDLMWHWMEANR
jgi:hypothetical protein